MWRNDEAYDFVVELGYNDDPVVSGHGSAIFLHCTAAGKYQYSWLCCGESPIWQCSLSRRLPTSIC